MSPGLQHLADPEPIQVAVRVRRATPVDGLDFDPGVGQPLREFLGGQSVFDEFRQPGHRDPHTPPPTRHLGGL
jgi:hypothetical protein